MAFSPNCQILAVGTGSTDELQLLDFQSNEVRTVSLGVQSISPLTFSHDGQTVVAGCRSGHVFVVDVATGQINWSIRQIGDRTQGLAFSPDDRLLAVTFSDGHLVVLHVPTRQPLLSHELAPYVPGAVAFSPDGKEVACAVSAELFAGRHGAIGSNRSIVVGVEAATTSEIVKCSLKRRQKLAAFRSHRQQVGADLRERAGEGFLVGDEVGLFLRGQTQLFDFVAQVRARRSRGSEPVQPCGQYPAQRQPYPNCSQSGLAPGSTIASRPTSYGRPGRASALAAVAVSDNGDNLAVERLRQGST